MSKNPLDQSVLIVGAGSIGKRHARVLNKLGVADLRAIDPSETQRQGIIADVSSIRLYDDYETALADRPDIVLICTPPDMHIPQAITAFEHGCHVLSEKPLCTDTARVAELIAKRDETGLKMMVAHCFRFHEGCLLGKQYLDSGRVGRLVSVRALMGEYLPDARPDYREMYMSKTTGAWDLMHDLDLAIWYANKPASRVRAFAGSYSDIGIEAADLVEILVDFDDQCMASVHLDFFQNPRRRQTELIGTEGVILIEFASWDACTVSVYERATGQWQHEEFKTDRDDMFRDEDLAFLKAIAEDTSVPCTIEQAVKSIEVILAAQADAKKS